MLPDRKDLLNTLPDPMKLTLARLAKHGWIMTNMCNTVQKFQKLLREVIESEAKENRIAEDESNVYEADFWHHLRNVWIGGGGP